MTDLFELDPTPRALNWSLWSRPLSGKRIVIARDYKEVISVERVRMGKWRARIVGIVGRPTELSPTFGRMEDAMRWAEERLPMIELAMLE